ncbi:hypothetical protein HYW21_02945 [Candidatus Woesearchaeota archaeon]|nr:hypothetical protein [Candidatus Woesearchaeota archaeon]
MPDDQELQSILRRFKQDLQQKLNEQTLDDLPHASREYKEFKASYMPKHMTFYEKACNFSERILQIKPNKESEAVLQESISICHLDITPTGALSFAILGPIFFIIISLLLSFVVPVILGANPSIFLAIFSILVGLACIIILQRIPEYFANNWRLKASNQMVLCIFYVVMYMRHTSNLERAIEFASEHLSPPLSIDLKKVLWDVESERYESVKESLDMYLESWRKWNLEFVESFHLIESSLYEGSEARRLSLLDKSLEVMLEETFEKMLHYAHNLKSPLNILNMLGIILPVLGLVILPLVVSFMGNVKWYHLAVLYNICIPLAVYYLGKSILSKRPTGYGDTDLSEENPELKKYRKLIIPLGSQEIKISPLWLSIIVFSFLFLIAISPLLIHRLNPDFDLRFADGKFVLLDYRASTLNPDETIGPFGFGAAIISLFFPLSFGIAIGLYYSLRSKNVYAIRNRVKELEREFASALFQLGNRLGDGLPAEIAFGKVAKVMEGTTSGKFFEQVSTNIKSLGMNVDEAIFGQKSGAIVYFPSKLIESSMKVLVVSVKKSPRIAANAIINISNYIKQIHRVDERLKDIMEDVITSMKSQVAFLAPVIAGIVIGITSMVSTIIGKLGQQMATLQVEEGTPITGMVGLFHDGVPTYYFQLMVGIYVVQVVYILSILVNGIENGSDTLNEEYLLGTYLIRSTLLYCVISLLVMVVFNIIAVNIIGTGMTG